MRLTKYMREAFVRAAMDDVPEVEDYEAEAHKLVYEDSILQLPEELQPIARDKNLYSFINMIHLWLYDVSFGSVMVFSDRGYKYEINTITKQKVLALEEKRNAQENARNELRAKLMGVAMSCTTRKALAEMLPDFEKYLPAEEAAVCRTVPVITNLVEDFAKAGWPVKKGEKK